jgi:twinkle protein
MTNNQPCHIANYRDTNGKIVAQKIRYADKRFQWTGEPNKATLFGKHLWSNNSNAITITEGEIDCLSIAEANDCKWPVVSIPNGAQSAAKTIRAELDWLSGFKQIILCFDNDEAGQKAVEDCVGLFPPGKVRIARLSKKDANEVLTHGSISELTKLIWNAEEYRPDGIIAGSEIDVDEIFQEDPIGLSLPYPILNDMIRGLKKSRIYTVYAGTGNGKTSFMKEVIYNLRKKHPKVKIGNIFLEESKNYTAKSYIALDNNIPTYVLEENPDMLTKAQKEKSKRDVIYSGDGEDTMFFYKHFGSLDSKRLFNMLEYLAIGKGVEVIVLDHISILVSGLESSGEGERRDIDKCMTLLRSFSERTGTILLVATQLKRTQGSYNTGADITEASARGSGAIEHLSDAIISINCDSDSENPNDAQLKVLKNRISGIKGKADLISYVNKTGRYLPKNNLTLIKNSAIINKEDDDLL